MKADATTQWRAGFGVATLDAWEPGRAMLGWGDPKNVANDVAIPLQCRAMALSQCDETGRELGRFVYLIGELCFITEKLRDAVCAALVARYEITAEEIMLVATHNHSGPGGFSDHCWFDIPSGGFSQRVFDGLVLGFVEAACEALEALEPASLRYLKAETGLHQIMHNRSWRAYNRNPDVASVDALGASLASDPTMRVLRADALDGTPLGLISWFPLHGTCIHGNHTSIRPDHKGIASRLLESEMGGGFVAIFAQEATGDITPNKRLDPVRKRMVGVAQSDEDSCFLVAQMQVDVARGLAARALHEGDVVTGALRSSLARVDFGGMSIAPAFTDGHGAQRTCLPQLGSGMIIGTMEGPGPFYLLRHLHRWLTTLYLWCWQKFSWGRAKPQAPRLVLLDSPRPLDLRAGGLFSFLHPFFPTFVHPDLRQIKRDILGGTPPGQSFFPRELPVQIVQVGSLILAGVAGEPTTRAGAAIRDALHRFFSSSDGSTALDVVTCSYANGYCGYIVTPYEYLQQDYEAGSTLYGRWTLSAWCAALHQVAECLYGDVGFEARAGMTGASVCEDGPVPENAFYDGRDRVDSGGFASSSTPSVSLDVVDDTAVVMDA